MTDRVFSLFLNRTMMVWEASGCANAKAKPTRTTTRVAVPPRSSNAVNQLSIRLFLSLSLSVLKKKKKRKEKMIIMVFL